MPGPGGDRGVCQVRGGIGGVPGLGGRGVSGLGVCVRSGGCAWSRGVVCLVRGGGGGVPGPGGVVVWCLVQGGVVCAWSGGCCASVPCGIPPPLPCKQNDKQV